MPKNKWIYIGVLVVAAVALIYAADWIIAHVKWILPYVGALGVLLIVVGVLIEAKYGKQGITSEAGGPEPEPPSPKA